MSRPADAPSPPRRKASSSAPAWVSSSMKRSQRTASSARTAPKHQPAIQLSPELELRKMLTLEQVTALTTLSADSLKRHHSDKIKRLGPRRLGMTLGDALAIGESA